MANTSATGGVLTPDLPPAPTPLDDDALMAVLQPWATALTGIPGHLVRPRWQPTMPVMPDISVDWLALGVVGTDPDAGPAIIHHGEGDGFDELQRHSDMDVLMSFYGPHSQGLTHQLLDGVSIPQNQPYNMPVIRTGSVIAAHELINNQWRRRYDLMVTLRSETIRHYAVKNIISAPIDTTTDVGLNNHSDISE